MTQKDQQRAAQIIHDFPKWTRPMSTEESELVDKYYDLLLMEDLNYRDDQFYFY